MFSIYCRRLAMPVCLLVPLLGTVACDDDDPLSTTTSADLTLDMTATVGSESLAMESSTYSAPGVAEGYRVSRLSFYVSEVSFVSEGPTGDLETPLVGGEVAYIEFGADGKAALSFEDVPVGSYDGLRFNLGLTPEQDATLPTDYAAGHPLAEASEYWVDWGSYIFLKIEGRSDTIADGAGSVRRGIRVPRR